MDQNISTENEQSNCANKTIKRSYLASTIKCKCPRCRQGDLFVDQNLMHVKNWLIMNQSCKVCDQPTEIEVGFYTGAAYAAYALTVALAVAVFVAWKVLIGFTLEAGDNRIFYCMGTAIAILILMVPVLMRISRSLWLSFFVHYDPDWKTNTHQHYERTNKYGMEHR